MTSLFTEGEKGVRTLNSKSNCSNDDLELLNQMYQNTAMGASAINSIIGNIPSGTFKDQLVSQLSVYNKVEADCEEQLYQRGAKPKEQNPVSKAMANAGIRIKSAKKPSEEHVSEMMINGSTMGVISLQRALNNHPAADQRIRKQAGELLAFERDNIDHMKPFL